MRFLLSSIFLIFLSTASAMLNAEERTATAVFAGGCFWCMEPPYDKLEGVISTTSGYIGGSPRTANYKDVSSGKTKHVEAVKIEYNPDKVNYQKLLDIFWVNIDPLDKAGQFCDKGAHYLSYIYFSNPQEKALAEKSRAKIAKKFEQPIATKIVEISTFYAAESYHQDYYQRNPIRYKYYRTGCGRDRRLRELWGKK